MRVYLKFISKKLLKRGKTKMRGVPKYETLFLKGLLFSSYFLLQKGSLAQDKRVKLMIFEYCYLLSINMCIDRE